MSAAGYLFNEIIQCSWHLALTQGGAGWAKRLRILRREMGRLMNEPPDTELPVDSDWLADLTRRLEAETAPSGWTKPGRRGVPDPLPGPDWCPPATTISGEEILPWTERE